jgi:DNA polymerase III subunit gamma/tau
VWDVRYRPMCFGDVLGQEGAVKVLKSRLEKGTATDTSYIFSGGAGRGKTTISRILGRSLLCQKLTPELEPCNQCENCKDALSETSSILSEMDAASRGTIEHTRAIVDNLAFGVQGASKKVYIIDEVHRMSRDAQDVLLKPIEDKQLVCIFCTTEPEKIRGPIRSRCEEYKIRKITRDDVLKRMAWILDREKVEYEPDAILIVIDHSAGHVRDVINKLEMIAQLGPISVESVRDNLNLSAVSTYYQILLSLGHPTEAIRLAEEACDRVGHEEVSEGLAEAAMNSYRLAHKMESEFSYFDRNLAVQVYESYKDATLRLAEYFLRSYKVSRMSLFGDILACHSGVPAPKSEASVIVSVAAPVAVVKTPEVALSAPSLASSVEGQAIPEKTVASTTAPISQSTPSPQPTRPLGSNLRADNVGNLGSGDPEALTSIDIHMVPISPPRGHEVTEPIRSAVSKEKFLTADEWKAKFSQRLEAASWSK